MERAFAVIFVCVERISTLGLHFFGSKLTTSFAINKSNDDQHICQGRCSNVRNKTTFVFVFIGIIIIYGLWICAYISPFKPLCLTSDVVFVVRCRVTHLKVKGLKWILLIRAYWVVCFFLTHSLFSTNVCPRRPPHLPLLTQLHLHWLYLPSFLWTALPFPHLAPAFSHKCCCFPLFPLPAGFPLLSPWFSDGHHSNWLQMVGGSEHCCWVGGSFWRGYTEVSGRFGVYMLPC